MINSIDRIIETNAKILTSMQCILFINKMYSYWRETTKYFIMWLAHRSQDVELKIGNCGPSVFISINPYLDSWQLATIAKWIQLPPPPEFNSNEVTDMVKMCDKFFFFFFQVVSWQRFQYTRKYHVCIIIHCTVISNLLCSKQILFALNFQL